MRDILMRLRSDAGQLTLGFLFKSERQRLAKSSSSENGLGSADLQRSRRNQAAPRLLRDRIRPWSRAPFTRTPSCAYQRCAILSLSLAQLFTSVSPTVPSRVP